MRAVTTIITFFACLAVSVSQITLEKKSNLVSKEAFSKKIAKDFNYLLLGENSPQQGLSATLNEKGSNIKINGLLYSGKDGIFTMEADLAASNGVYFFDTENGSEQGKVTLNYYKALRSWSTYRSEKIFTKVNTKLRILSLIAKAHSDFKRLDGLLIENIGVIDQERNKITEEILRLSGIYINKRQKLGYEQLKNVEFKYRQGEYDLDKDMSINLEELIQITQGDGVQIIKSLDGADYNKIRVTNKDLGKILNDYTTIKNYILTTLEDDINEIELANAASEWKSNHMFFLGASPFYQRESFKRFQYDPTKTFSKMFSKERGNIYGVTLSLNYSYEKGKGSRNKLAAHRFFSRISMTLNRASNISNFRTSTLDITTPLGNDVNGSPIAFGNSDKAFIGNNTYEYGFGSAFNLEMYYYPFKSVGLFGKIGYQNIKFNRESLLKDVALYPMRLGVLFNVTGKNKSEPIVTIQTFIDRTNLNLDPNGEDKDLRFGIGIGLPINIR